VDVAEETDLYDLRFVRRHAERAGREEWSRALAGSEAYAAGCRRAGFRVNAVNRHHLALRLYSLAEETYHCLVAAGRTELENDLAAALSNKGVALNDLKRFSEASSALDAAIAIRRRLVEGGRTELESDLATALMNKGVALKQTWQMDAAFESFSCGIAVLEQHFQRGATFLAADLIKACRVCFDLCRQVQQWPAAAEDLLKAMDVYSTVGEAGEITPPVQREFGDFIQALHRLSPDEREQVFAALGDNADPIREILEDTAEG
jgi:hypothetical protein